LSEIEKRKVKFMSIGTDKARPLKKLAEKNNYGFSIIPDTDAKISKEYHNFGKPIDYDMLKFELAIPSTYLINLDGEIVWRYIGTKTDRPEIDAILNAIDTKL
jgi:peroxiredoxin